MASKGEIYKLVEAVGNANDGQPGQTLEKTPRGIAMREVVSEVAARPDVDGSQLMSLSLVPAYMMALAVLSELSDSRSKPVNAHLPQKEKITALDKPAPATPSATVAGDYYNKLGVSRDASKEEIDQAYRAWAKQNHPDVLRSKGASDADIAAAEENAILMGEAYAVLKNPKERPQYDKFYDETFAKGKPPVVRKEPVALLEDTTSSGSSYINVSFTPSVDKKAAKESPYKTQDFQDIATAGGAFEMDSKLLGEMQAKGQLPEGFNSSHVQAGVQFYARGAKSEDIFNAAKSSEYLTPDQKMSLFQTAFAVECLENSSIEGLPSHQSFFTANQEPSFLLTESTAALKPSGRSFSLRKKGKGTLSPVVGMAESVAQEKLKGLAEKGIADGAKKLILKGGSQVAAKAGLSFLGKAGLAQLIGTIFPGVGNAAALIATAIGAAWGLVKSGFKALVRVISSDGDVGKATVTLLLLAAAALMMFGAVTPALALGFTGSGVAVVRKFSGTKFGFNAGKKGGRSSGDGGGGVFANFVFGVISVAVAAVSLPVILASSISILLIIVTVVILNTGAYVVPPSPLTGGLGGQVESPYIGVKKEGESTSPAQGPSSSLKYFNADLRPLTVTYTVTITAKRGPLINVVIEYDCKAKKRITDDTSQEIPCPPVSGSIPSAPPGGTVSPSDSFTFTYSQTYNDPTFKDSSIVDTITVRADTAEKSGITGAAFAAVCIGDCPEDCPSIWPILPEGTETSLNVTQGPEGNYSHSIVEAMDISAFAGHSVFATHEGVISKVELSHSPPYGVHVDVLGVCGGREFVSRYAHLTDVASGISEGVHVQQNVVLGLSGNTGTGGAHLHYEFRNCSPAGCSYTKSRGGLAPWMELPFIPKDMGPGFRGCDSSSCGSVP